MNWRLIMNNFYKYFSYYKKHSILFKNFILIILCVTVPLLILSYSLYSIEIKNAKKNYEQNALFNASALTKTFESTYEQVKMMGYTISCNPDIINYCQSPPYYDKEEEINSVIKQVTQPINIYPFIDSVYVYSSKTQYIISNTFCSTLERFTDRSLISIIAHQESAVKGRLKYNKYPYLLSFVTPIYDYFHQPCGSVVVNVNIQQFVNSISTDNNDFDIYITDQNNYLIYCNDSNLLNEHFMSNDLSRELDKMKRNVKSTTIAAATESGEANFLIIQNSKFSPFNDNSIFNVIFIALLLVLFSFILSVFLTIKTFRPIGYIIETLDDDPINYGVLPINNEVQYIINKINSTIKEKENIETELEERLQLLNNAYATALQSQINPHFLYNTLESINFLAYDVYNGPNDISTITLNLAHILRMSLDSNDKLIPLSMELSCLQLYIDILKIRYENKCDYTINIPNKYMDKKIMKLTLQPIVENAFSHGIKPLKTKGLISIDAYDDGKTMYITVSDNGVGMSNDKYERINNLLSGETIINSKHIGLNNVNDRLKLLYGKEYGVKCTKHQNGCEFVISIPIE